jgi:hypothetical protein
MFNNIMTDKITIKEKPFTLIQTPVNVPIPQTSSRSTVPFVSL